MSNTVAVCPGSFDPVTSGHEDIIRRAATLFCGVYAVVAVNSAKKYMFDADTRVEMCKKVFADLPAVTVVKYDGLVVDFCREVGASVIVKGVRGSADFEYETNIADINARLSSGQVETLLLPTRPELRFVSSSAVRELLSYNADVSGYVSEKIINDIKK